MSILVKTIVAERILQALDYCRDESAMIYIAGPTGRGKTFTSQYWVEHNAEVAKYIRVSSNCSRRTIANNLCRTLGISHSGSAAQCENNLRKVLNPRSVIVADEAGHLLNKVGSIELLRDLHDMTGCGVALIFTDVYLNEIKRGRDAAYFEQFLGRLEFPIEIEKMPRKDEVRTVLKSYIKDVSEKHVELALQVARGRDGQLRTLYKDLERAKSFADEQGRNVQWEDVKRFVQWRKSTGAWPEDC